MGIVIIRSLTTRFRIDLHQIEPAARRSHVENIGVISRSFDTPHLILVLTSVNQRHSLSGSVPILVPR